MAKSPRTAGGGQDKSHKGLMIDLPDLLVAIGDTETDPGSMTAVEWGKHWGVSRRAAFQYLVKAIEKGICTRATKFIVDAGGRRQRVGSYIFTKQEDAK